MIPAFPRRDLESKKQLERAKENRRDVPGREEGECRDELPDERRIVVVLRDLEGLSYEEIAAALDLPTGTVRSRLHRARLDLKDKLERFLP